MVRFKQSTMELCDGRVTLVRGALVTFTRGQLHQIQPIFVFTHFAVYLTTGGIFGDSVIIFDLNKCEECCQSRTTTVSGSKLWL